MSNNPAKHFMSRSEARKYARENGMKLIDLGESCAAIAFGRWLVTDREQEKAMNDLTQLTQEMGLLKGGEVQFVTEGSGSTSAFFVSRTEARDFAKKVNGKVVDHASTGRFVHKDIVLDLGKQGKRWEVVYTSTDELYDDRILGAEEKYVERASEEETTAIQEAIDSAGEPVILMTLKNLQVTLPDGKNFVISRSNEDFALCAKLFSEGKIAELIEAIDVDKKPKEWSFGDDLKVIAGTLYHHGMAVESSIAKRIVEDCDAGIDVQKYVNFFRKMIKNTSYKAVQMVYDFIKHNDLVIMEDGNIRAWKMINSNGYDCHSGKVPNFVGMTVCMPRNMVEDDPDVTCSQGLHVAAKHYFAFCFGSQYLIEVSVSPEDIVSVPTDYDNSKCRCCKYTVLTGLDKPSNIPDEVWIGVSGAHITGEALVRIKNEQ